MDPLTAFLPTDISIALAAALIASSAMTAAITAAFGLGGGVLLLAILVSVVSPVLAIPIHAALQAGANVSRAWLMRSNIQRDLLLWFLPGALLGTVIGAQFVTALPLRILSLILAAFILWSVWAPKPQKRALKPRAFAAVGAASSFASLFIGASGPLVAAFLPPAAHGRLATVATHGAMMSVQHLLKIIAFGMLGVSMSHWLPLIALMLASGVLGSVVGKATLQRLPEAVFAIVFRALMTALAVKLLVDALMPS